MGATSILGSMLAAEGVGFSILPTLILVPLATAALIALLPASRADYTKLAALFGSVITGALAST